MKLLLKADPNDSNLKRLGGADSPEWNTRLNDLTINALPIAHSKNRDSVISAAIAVCRGTMDMAPADPVEGILIAQLVAANEASLAMYTKGWAQPPEYFEARTKYLKMADKAARTVMMLTERLDHHRGRGQQQITVKHVTVNADQAIVGNVEHHQGVGLEKKSRDQPHAIAYSPGVTLSGPNQERQALPIAGDEKRPVPDARRDITRRTKGK